MLAKTREQVDAFHAAAVAAGMKDDGGPGLRQHYHPTYYAAFVRDAGGLSRGRPEEGGSEEGGGEESQARRQEA